MVDSNDPEEAPLSDIPSDVLQVILDDINQKCNLELTKDAVVVSLPTPAERQHANTQVQVSVPNLDMNVRVYYHRLELARLFEIVNREFEDQGETTVLELLPRLADRRRVTLDPNEFLDAPIERTDGLATITLIPKSESLTFTGSVELLLGESVLALALLTNEGEPLLTNEGDFILILE